MSDSVYFISDDSCEPLDPESLLISRMNKELYLERYSNTDWTFDSYDEAVKFCREGIE